MVGPPVDPEASPAAIETPRQNLEGQAQGLIPGISALPAPVRRKHVHFHDTEELRRDDEQDIAATSGASKEGTNGQHKKAEVEIDHPQPGERETTHPTHSRSTRKDLARGSSAVDSDLDMPSDEDDFIIGGKTPSPAQSPARTAAVSVYPADNH